MSSPVINLNPLPGARISYHALKCCCNHPRFQSVLPLLIIDPHHRRRSSPTIMKHMTFSSVAFAALGVCPSVTVAFSPTKLHSIVAVSTAASRANAVSPNNNAVSNFQVKPLYDPAPAINYEDCFWQKPFIYGGKNFYAVSI